MQKILTVAKMISNTLGNKTMIAPNLYGSFKNATESRLLTPITPMINLICNMKVKGRVRRRCKACYFVVRDQRYYIMCPKFPRHKQMAMRQKPHNRYILTSASQSPVRPW
ncbi:unnamed protein product [Diatraea saccharalis]|uniref:Large ribosomal subunit protein bL36m n=1 Tax=Diatraea saccharalis TaxID=40085 RepID=A0A9N9RAT6_9NEOP|nr:unnamed protein product [Diatraea saccharalis]